MSLYIINDGCGTAPLMPVGGKCWHLRDAGVCSVRWGVVAKRGGRSKPLVNQSRALRAGLSPAASALLGQGAHKDLRAVKIPSLFPFPWVEKDLGLFPCGGAEQCAEENSMIPRGF